MAFNIVKIKSKDEFLKTLEYAWDHDPEDHAYICIYHYGERIMRIYGEEVIQCLGRKFTMNLVRELDKCDYIKDWQKEKYEEVTDILKK